nr:apolipoprotein N-acyltransferase [Puniceibacterium sediminis]
MGAGGVFALGQAPYDLWAVAFLGLVVVFVLARLVRHGWAGTAWAFGVGHFGLGLSWIVEPFQVDAAATGWMAPFALFGIAAGLALFWALAFRCASLAGQFWALVPFWAAAELARAYVLTGFPWAHVSYLWAPSPAIQWVSVLGPHGLGLLTLALAALTATALTTLRVLPTLGAVFLAGVLLAGGLWLTPPKADLAGRPIVRLVQPNAPQEEKWDRTKAQLFFERQVDFTAAVPAPDSPVPALTVWPETALPMLLGDAGMALAVIADAAGPTTSVIVGVQREEGGAYYNSLVVTGSDGAVHQVYDKHHLVPFGEYMPWASLFARFNILGLAARADGGFSSGPGPTLLDLGLLGHALPLICYEAVFPQDVSGAPSRPGMLLQITNDAWFGKRSGPYQHLAQARIRSIEQGLPMLRAANTGVSAVIDGGGRILGQIPLGQAGYLDLPLPPALAATPYSRTGDLPILLLLTCLCLYVLLIRLCNSR